MNRTDDRALSVTTAIADRLTEPRGIAAPPGRCWPQSLAKGAAGIALLHIECAHAGLAGWDTAHAWLKTATGTGISVVDDTGLFLGAPAVAFALHTASGSSRYTRALAKLDAHITALTHRRVDRAQVRIDRGELPRLDEFDLIYGLSGVGAYLLRRAPCGDALERVLSYLVRLTEPLYLDDRSVPGWWVGHDPSFTISPEYSGGHGNLGMAHGVAGPLALLASALRCGFIVDGHVDAIGRICDWLDAWRQEGDTGPWWPQWVTCEDLLTRRPRQSEPMRPSWCYGTPGLARAQQLAGMATGDIPRQHMAERALAGCLGDPAQLGRIIDTSLCHGWAGLFQTAWRAARDARTPVIADRLSSLADLLVRHGHPGAGEGIGFLEGDAGLALALYTAACTAPPLSGWDACLLVA